MNIDWTKAPKGAEFWCDDQWFKSFNGEWFVWYPGSTSWSTPAYKSPDNFSWWGRAVKRPKTPAWNGEGLPPVGQSCERRFIDVEGSSWLGCIVLAHGAKKIFIRDNAGDEFAHSMDEVEFRPFRTPEQIEAEERDKAINQMEFDTDYLDRGAFTKLYNAGWRKQVSE